MIYILQNWSNHCLSVVCTICLLEPGCTFYTGRWNYLSWKGLPNPGLSLATVLLIRSKLPVSQAKALRSYFLSFLNFVWCEGYKRTLLLVLAALHLKTTSWCGMQSYLGKILTYSHNRNSRVFTNLCEIW